MNEQALLSQLEKTCRMTNARWAVVINFLSDGWTMGTRHGLSNVRQRVLGDLLDNEKTIRWLAGAVGSGRVRSRKLGEEAKALGCGQIFVFPNIELQRVIVVGGDELDSSARKIFKIINYTPDQRSIGDSSQTNIGDSQKINRGTFGFESELQRVLDKIGMEINADSGYIAIRQGDIFQLEAFWRCAPKRKGLQISIHTNPTFADLSVRGYGEIINDPTHLKALTNKLKWDHPVEVGVSFPIITGQREIGMVNYFSCDANRFSRSVVAHGENLARIYAATVDNAMIFAVAERQLQRFALLNELAAAASVGGDIEKISRRVIRLMRRTFQTERVSLLVVSPDNTQVRGFGRRTKTPALLEDIEKGSISDFVLSRGRNVLVGEMDEPPRYVNMPSGALSALAVPLKYQREIIGTIELESQEPEAFNHQDEQLLSVIASHLAGYIQNVRLNEETSQWAQSLVALHQIVQQLIGLTEEEEIIKKAVELTVEAFHHDIALVYILKGENNLVMTLGAQEGAFVEAANVRTHIPLIELLDQGLMDSSDSTMLQGTEAKSIISDALDWQPVTQMYFPLLIGDQTNGLFVVQRKREPAYDVDDLMLVESLVGILSSVLTNIRLFDELETRMVAQRSTEQKLIQSARLAAVGEMASGVAHELNNPLTTIAGFAELILSDLDEETPMRDDLQLILRESQRARSVVRRLLDFSRQGDSIKTATDLNEVVSEVLALVNHLARTTGVTIQIELWEELEPVEADRNQLKQVLLNLVHNGLQAMPSGGMLVVRTSSYMEKDRRWNAIEVQDEGTGIAPENLERIFDPFFTTKPVGQGTGLGLSISYSIISDHDGELEVTSDIGHGTCFYVKLPTIRPGEHV